MRVCFLYPIFWFHFGSTGILLCMYSKRCPESSCTRTREKIRKTVPPRKKKILLVLLFTFSQARIVKLWRNCDIFVSLHYVKENSVFNIFFPRSNVKIQNAWRTDKKVNKCFFCNIYFTSFLIPNFQIQFSTRNRIFSFFYVWLSVFALKLKNLLFCWFFLTFFNFFNWIIKLQDKKTIKVKMFFLFRPEKVKNRDHFE